MESVDQGRYIPVYTENLRENHHPAAQIAGIDAARLRSFVDRITNLDSEVREIAAQVKEVYDEAALSGFDKLGLKHVMARLRRRRKNPADVDALDFIVEEYEAALGFGKRLPPPEVITVAELQREAAEREASRASKRARARADA